MAGTTEATPTQRGWVRRLAMPVLGFALALAVVWGLGQIIELQTYRSTMRKVEGLMGAGHYREAGEMLSKLERRHPGRADIEFALGMCHQASGNLDVALKAWERVPDDSTHAGPAALLRARILLGRHRLGEAEPLLMRALRGGGIQAVEARQTLAQIAKIEGRIDEVRRWLLEDLDRQPNPVATIREVWRLDHYPFPVADIVPLLDRAEKAAPDDDRIALGRANVAIHQGRYDEAEHRLDTCLKRRPNDPAVWRARLAWARATDRLDEVRRAVPRIQAERIDPAELLALRAWVAVKQIDVEAERAALTRAIERTPDRPGTLDRLVELELGAGHVEEAGRLRKRTEEVHEDVASYESLLFSADRDSPTAELARLAARLRRPVEARYWASLALRRAPRDREIRALVARLQQPSSSARADAATISDLMAALNRATSGASGPGGSSRAPSVPTFVDEARSAGLVFTFDQGATPLRQLPETMSGGLAVLDYDGDGWLDVYAVQGGHFPPRDDDPNGDRLFHNKGDGTFEDATERAGISRLPGGYGHGVAVGDFDNDGHPDLLLTRWRRYALLRNRGDGTFEDVTDAAGLGGAPGWPTSAAFADLDGDGDLDLYVCHYLQWDPAQSKPCHNAERRRAVYCPPLSLPAEADHLFRNDGGKFVDVASEAGIVDRDGRGLGIVAADLDEDGKLDLYVANDQTPNFLFRNLGGMRFEEVGHSSGVATDANGASQASMGVACGDANGDGRPDLAVTNFYGESTTLYQNLGHGQFADRTGAVGLAGPSRYLLGFGLAFLDANNDGQLDLAATYGHVDDLTPALPYAMPSQLFLGGADGRLVDVSSRAGPGWTVPRVGRGLVAADMDNDGRLDVLPLPQSSPVACLRNTTQGGHFLTLQLEGSASGRDAIGARVTVEAHGRRQSSWRFGGGSYQSAGDPRLHFGLGEAKIAERVEVAWPSGRIDRFDGLAADRGYRLREGQPEATRLTGWAR